MKSEKDKMGFPPGVAKKIVLSVSAVTDFDLKTMALLYLIMF